MKKLFILSLFCLAAFMINAQTTITLQPNATDGKDAFLAGGNQSNMNYGYHEEVTAAYWTVNGQWIPVRSLLEFDLSQIPTNATITNAKLSLWCATATTSQTQLHSGDNESTISRVTSAWNENTVTWNNQPSVTTQNQVILPTSTSNTQDYLNIDVTDLFQDIVSSGNNNGLMLQLTAEYDYQSMVLASSDYSNAAKRPKLEITYVIAQNNCLTIQPDAADGKDAFLAGGNQSNMNYGNHEEVTAAYWTVNGQWIPVRSLLEFDLSQIPANATITNAKLSLWCATATTSQTQLQSGDNESVINRVTSAWNENTVTWNNKPSVSTQNQVVLSASTSNTQDYLNIDVTDLYQDIISSGNNYGVMLQLASEYTYQSMVLASSDYSNAAKRPKLEICYSLPSSVVEADNNNQFNIYPNPTNGIVFINSKTEINNDYSISVTDITGRVLLSNTNAHLSGKQSVQLNIANLASGAYFVKLQNGNQHYTKRIFKN